jgi:Flp pilus assembly pilin Flp
MKVKFAKRFLADEVGAVTVDWMVLTGGVLIVGVLVTALIVDGTTDVSTGTGARLGAAAVPDITFD